MTSHYLIFFAICILAIWQTLKHRIGANTLIYLSSISLGFAVLYTSDITDSQFCFNVLLSSLLVSVLISIPAKSSTQAHKRIAPGNNIDGKKRIRVLYFLIIAISIYHYAIIGIPFFSSDFDQSRFEIAKSGFLGLPSRIAVYGPPVLLWLSALGDRIRIGTIERIFLVVAGLLLFSVTGHKSSLLGAVMCMIIIMPILTKSTRSIVKKAAPVVFVLALILFIYSFARLGSLDAYADNMNFYVLDRMTYMSVLPVYEAYTWTGFEKSNLFDNPLLLDIIYPIQKIFDLNVQTFNAELSRSIYGVRDEEFTVPVTPGFYAYHVAALNSSLAYIACAIFALIYRRLRILTLAERSVGSVLLLLTITYGLYIGYATGNSYYLLFNLAPVMVIVKVCFIKWRI